MKEDRIYFFRGVIILCVGLLSTRDLLVSGRAIDSSASSASLSKQGLHQNHVIDDDEDDNFKRPWEINRNICPPVLCRWLNNRKVEVDNDDEPASFPFFEGDIVLDDELEQVLRPNTSRKQGVALRIRTPRAIIKPVTRLWPFGIIPYVIDPNLGNRTRHLINVAIDHFANYTCIKFRPKTDKDVDYIHYIYQPGCWSSVGRTGGRQYISLGVDCDKLGIILHETSHTIGFWHEQSRPDRDRFVKVMKRNIDPNSLEQFLKRTLDESGSRGYAYDYNSIMHYAGNYYSDNGRETIKLVGIGKRFQFRIGQRMKLSDLDIAQLNDIYYCHRKEAEREHCREGWIKFRSSCYRFIHNDTLPFFPASRRCRSLRSRLVIINDADEDAFLRSHLKSHYPLVGRWRTGAVRLSPSDEYLWYLAGSGGHHLAMNYTAWIGGKPYENASSLVLVAFNKTTNGGSGGNGTRTNIQFEWSGAGKGSGKRPLAFSYPFICEAKAKVDCFENEEPHGRDYRGHLSYTSEGATCQRWSKYYPHNHTIALDRDEGIGDHNHCRNPHGIRHRPWCFTLLKDVLWQYCDVHICNHIT